MRDVWYKSSYLLDMRQSGNECAGNRYENYKMQPLEYKFHKDFVGTLASYKLTADRRKRSGVRAAILRDKGTNGEREMAYTLYLAGFDVKDVHLTDLASGRETLENVNRPRTPFLNPMTACSRTFSPRSTRMSSAPGSKKPVSPISIG